MTRNILCAIYLLIAISTVHSASYYNLAGREVIVPSIEEVKEVVAELKKHEPVVIEEIIDIAAVPVVPAVPDVVVKNLPSESVVPAVENVESSVVTASEPEVIVSDVSAEARAKPNPDPNPLLRLDTLEVIQPGVKPEKVVTVAETVKNAVVQAIEKQNEEVLESKVTDAAPVVKSVPVVENIEPSVKVAEPVPEFVDHTKTETVEPVAVPVVEKVEPVEKVQESVRSADPEPVKTEVVAEEVKVEKPVEAAKVVEKAVVEVPLPEIRQQNPAQGALDGITNTINTLATNFQTAVQNALAPLNNIKNLPTNQQSDAPVANETPSVALNTAEVAPMVVTNAGIPVSSTQAPIPFLAPIQNAISSFTNILQRPTTSPAVAPVAPEVPVISGTRGSEEQVEVVQNIAVVNDKVDSTKQ